MDRRTRKIMMSVLAMAAVIGGTVHAQEMGYGQGTAQTHQAQPGTDHGTTTAPGAQPRTDQARGDQARGGQAGGNQAQARDGQRVQVMVDGQTVNFERAHARIEGGTPMIPLRRTFEQMGATVHWVQEERTVYVTHEGRQFTVNVPAQTQWQQPTDRQWQDDDAQWQQDAAQRGTAQQGATGTDPAGQNQVGQNQAGTDQPGTAQPGTNRGGAANGQARIENGRTIVPIDFVRQHIAANVDWRPDNMVVMIDTRDTVAGMGATERAGQEVWRDDPAVERHGQEIYREPRGQAQPGVRDDQTWQTQPGAQDDQTWQQTQPGAGAQPGVHGDDQAWNQTQPGVGAQRGDAVDRTPGPGAGLTPGQDAQRGDATARTPGAGAGVTPGVGTDAGRDDREFRHQPGVTSPGTQGVSPGAAPGATQGWQDPQQGQPGWGQGAATAPQHGQQGFTEPGQPGHPGQAQLGNNNDNGNGFQQGQTERFGMTAQERIRVTLNGQDVRFADQEPIMRQNRVYVPLRGVFEQMGAQVQWNAQNRQVVARHGQQNIVLPVGQRYATVNNQRVNLDAPAMIVEGRTMVPLRFVSETLGAQVQWQEDQRTVVINHGQAGQPQQFGQGVQR
jgi:hypothetical protein